MIQSWGNDGRLANRRLERSVDSVRLSSLTYSYDVNDNITAITDTLQSTKTLRFAYDSLDRMITRVSGEGTYLREDYTFDANGNRTMVDWRATETSPTPAVSDRYLIGGSTNRLTQIVRGTAARTFTYDARGNQIGERLPDNSLTSVTYDGYARLTSYASGGSSQAMLYNGEDERIRVVTTPFGGVVDTRVYVYDLDHRIVGEYGAGGTTDIKAEYIWLSPEVDAAGPTGGDDGLGGYMPLAYAVGTAGNLVWVHSHHNGAPLLTTNASGTTTPYADQAVLGFPGQFANAKLLAGAQHYYNRYRDYNPDTGRYIQADPIGLAGDANPYAYAMGNNLRYLDPVGLAPVCNYSNRRILVGGSAPIVTNGATVDPHGHIPGSPDDLSLVTLEPGQCISKWERRMGTKGSLSDVDVIDLDCDGKVFWPGTRGIGWKVREYIFDEAFQGSSSASGRFPFPTVENQFVILRNKSNGGITYSYEIMGLGRHRGQ